MNISAQRQQSVQFEISATTFFFLAIISINMFPSLSIVCSFVFAFCEFF